MQHVATQLDLALAGARQLQVLADTLVLDLVRLRAVGRGRVERVAGLEVGHGGCEGFLEGGGHAVLYVDARVGDAGLAADEADAEGRLGGGSVDVGVGEDDCGALAAQLEDHALEVALGRVLLHQLARGAAAREVDAADVHVRC